MHLVDGHLSSVAVDKLNETTALAWGDLHIGDFTKALKEGSQLILSDISRQTTNEDSSVVRVRKLVHLGGRVESAATAAAATTTIRKGLLHASTPHLLLRHAAHHGIVVAVSKTMVAAKVVSDWKRKQRLIKNLPVLGGGRGNSHGTVTAIDSLHLNEGTLLVVLIGEANKAISPALAGHGVRHDLSTFTARESSLEKRDEDIFVDLGAKITDENTILGAAVVA